MRRHNCRSDTANCHHSSPHHAILIIYHKSIHQTCHHTLPTDRAQTLSYLRNLPHHTQATIHYGNTVNSAQTVWMYNFSAERNGEIMRCLRLCSDTEKIIKIWVLQYNFYIYPLFSIFWHKNVKHGKVIWCMYIHMLWWIDSSKFKLLTELSF